MNRFPISVRYALQIPLSDLFPPSRHRLPNGSASIPHGTTKWELGVQNMNGAGCVSDSHSSRVEVNETRVSDLYKGIQSALPDLHSSASTG